MNNSRSDQVEDGGKKREAAAAAPSTIHVAGVKKADITKAAAMRDPDKEAEHETGGSRKAARVGASETCEVRTRWG